MTPFTGERSRRGYRLNRFLVSFTDAANRAAYAEDAKGYMDRHGLTAEERTLLAARDWNALLEYGASIYALAKAGSVFGTNLVEMGAAMRGQSVAEFMATKRPRGSEGG
ncbi:protocatechuate 3,4-dioxygenase [Siccirubricoccus phaeus]|uniref:protocatechuate 3,4-dioxygenase n=1 Tax=Siccirubricoccus phaeus TaxID=2595053 RepID=UPI0011F1F04F|nr:protocatechuate 3,4-dioxygenase [Siccirubricoccus phaeus]